MQDLARYPDDLLSQEPVARLAISTAENRQDIDFYLSRKKYMHWKDFAIGRSQ